MIHDGAYAEGVWRARGLNPTYGCDAYVCSLGRGTTANRALNADLVRMVRCGLHLSFNGRRNTSLAPLRIGEQRVLIRISVAQHHSMFKLDRLVVLLHGLLHCL
jgi:hypothetical protein